jgi:2-haloalkanoic acid dehalogenase type II
VLSFDVFGTLVDWERGLSEAAARTLQLSGPGAARPLVAARAEVEWTMIEELEDFRPYRDLLADSLVAAGPRAGLPVARAQAEAIAASLPEWPLFEDVAGALDRLAQRYRLALVSNCDRTDLEAVARRLGTLEAHLVAAGDVEAYKPEPDHLLALMHELELDEDEVLHVSAHADYDLETAMDLGLPAAYVDRRGEPLPEGIEVLRSFATLDALADALVKRRRR